MNNLSFSKIGFTSIGSLLAFFQPVWVFFLIAFMALAADCYTAFRLSKRVKRTSGASTGKFRSSKGKKIIDTIIKVSYAIIFAFLVDKYILISDSYYSVKLLVGGFSFIQIWSILENESSASDKPWAKMLQRIMVDKAERHFDIDLHELKEQNNG